MEFRVAGEIMIGRAGWGLSDENAHELYDVLDITFTRCCGNGSVSSLTHANIIHGSWTPS